MSETDSKVFMIPDNNSNNCAEMMALMNNQNNWNNNPFMYLIWLAFFGGGFGGFGWGNRAGATVQGAEVQGQIAQLQQTVNDNHNNDLAMQAILGNGAAIHELATTLGCSTSSLSNAIGRVETMVGMSGKDIVNGILLGNKDLMQQISTCCCENKQLVTTMGYEGQLRDQTNTCAITTRIDQLANGVLTGFASNAYEVQAQTNALNFNLQNQTQALKDTANANTDAILAKLNQMTTDAQQDKINTLTAQLTAANSRAERAAELLPIINQLNSIKASQPSTVAVQYPQLTAYPSYLNAAAYNSVYGGSSTPGFWN